MINNCFCFDKNGIETVAAKGNYVFVFPAEFLNEACPHIYHHIHLNWVQ
jgi:hypothetical protein